VAVSGVGEEEAAVEACLNFLLFLQPGDLTRFSPLSLSIRRRRSWRTWWGPWWWSWWARGSTRYFLLFVNPPFSFTLDRLPGGGIQGRGGPPRGWGGPGRGGRGGGRGGARGGAKTIIEPHRHPGIFIAKAKESMLVTKNLVPGESVYGEKRITVEGTEPDTKVEYRVWNPFRSKLAAGVLGGLDNIFIAPGKKVLYLGAASGTSVSHVADIVGPVRLSCSLQLSPTYLAKSCSDSRRELSMLLNSR